VLHCGIATPPLIEVVGRRLTQMFFRDDFSIRQYLLEMYHDLEVELKKCSYYQRLHFYR
jgi:hypothetical protein